MKTLLDFVIKLLSRTSRVDQLRDELQEAQLMQIEAELHVEFWRGVVAKTMHLLEGELRQQGSSK